MAHQRQNEYAAFNQAIRSLKENEILDFENNGEITILGVQFSHNRVLHEGKPVSFRDPDILITRQPKPNSSVVTNGEISLQIDLTLNDDLIAEGLAREIISHIQKLRKTMDFNVADRIAVYYLSDHTLESVMKNFKDMISQETLATELIHQSAPNMSTQDIDGYALQLAIVKV